MSGRIPQQFIDQLLDRIDIVDLIDGFVPLKKAGTNYKACCPFHGEKTPSFTVSQEKQFYHCFGCGANGSAISFLMEHNHQEFREAIETLAQQAGMEIPEEATSNQQSPKTKTQDGVDLYKLISKVSDFYEDQLKTHPQAEVAKNYLKDRGLTGEIAKRFHIGFVPDAWDTVMKLFGTSEKQQTALLQAGLLTKNDDKNRIYDKFRNRIMFPITDYRGRMVGFGGRVMDDGEPKYLNSPETPIFHKGAELYGFFEARGEIRNKNLAIAVEGYMDVIALAQYDINIAVAALGTALTNTHLQRLFRITSNIVVCFDGDRAGRQAAWRAMENSLPLLEDGRGVRFLFLPQGEDPDSMVRQKGKEVFMQLADQALPLTDFLVDNLKQECDINTLEGRAKLANDLKPYLQKLPNGMLKALLIERISKITDIQTETLNQQVAQSSQNQPRNQKQVIRKGPNTQQLSIISRAISLVLQNPKLARTTGDVEPFLSSLAPGYALFGDIIKTVTQHSGLNTASLIERYRENKHLKALEKLAFHPHNLDEEQQTNEYHATIVKLRVELAEHGIEMLIQKDQTTGLSPIEKEELKNLLNSTKKR
jgi:DNA primase